MSGLVLAVDLGTSSLRAATIDEHQSVVQLVQHSYDRRARSAAGTFAAQPLAQLFQRSLAELNTTGVARVAVSALWHSVLGVDAADRPVTDVYTWESTSPSLTIGGLKARLDTEAYRGRTGSYLHASYPLAAIWWLRQHGDRSARYTDLPSWLLRQVLGVECRWSEQIAAGSGFWNQQQRTWDTSTCNAAGLDAELLAEIWREPVTLTSQKAAAFGLAGSELLPVLADGVCDNVGLGATGDRSAALTSGTSGSVRMLLDEAHQDVPRGLWRYRVGEHRTAIGGANSNFGNLFEWIRTNLGCNDPLGFGAGEPPDFDGLIATPHLFGERGPDYEEQATAGLAGIRPHHTVRDLAAELVLAALGTTRRLALLAYEVKPSLDDLVASGGIVTQAPGFAQLLADAVGRDVRVSNVAESSLRGAALLAQGASPTHPRRRHMIHPRPEWTAAIDLRLTEAASRVGS